MYNYMLKKYSNIIFKKYNNWINRLEYKYFFIKKYWYFFTNKYFSLHLFLHSCKGKFQTSLTVNLSVDKYLLLKRTLWMFFSRMDYCNASNLRSIWYFEIYATIFSAPLYTHWWRYQWLCKKQIPRDSRYVDNTHQVTIINSEQQETAMHARRSVKMNGGWLCKPREYLYVGPK